MEPPTVRSKIQRAAAEFPKEAHCLSTPSSHCYPPGQGLLRGTFIFPWDPNSSLLFAFAHLLQGTPLAHGLWERPEHPRSLMEAPKYWAGFFSDGEAGQPQSDWAEELDE